MLRDRYLDPPVPDYPKFLDHKERHRSRQHDVTPWSEIALRHWEDAA